MEQAELLVCSNCETTHESTQQDCEVCHYPILGTDKEQSKFLAKQINQKAEVKDSLNKMKLSKNLLFGIGVFNLCMVAFQLLVQNTGFTFGVGIQTALGGLFMFFAYMTNKSPLFATGGPIIMYLIYIGLLGILDSSLIFEGIFFKIGFFMILGYGFYSTLVANKILKENEYLATTLSKK
ncbi:hypothetical protein [Flammeovirga pacifica]|uniref:Uncharacterized protein n=1 Tax=Flammeovirga pacifica TaxID=915059 RepID=A0A1S1YXM1_FLAPC|nr:hypothetical protein [Flammeovirga pacifica]OHX65751.1 hypothetical protein NH26_04995 [Flammeovirga pacifica]